MDTIILFLLCLTPVICLVCLFVLMYKSENNSSSNVSKSKRNITKKKSDILLKRNEVQPSEDFKSKFPVPIGTYLIDFTDMDIGVVMSDNHPPPVRVRTFQEALKTIEDVDNKDDEREIRIHVYDSNYEVILIKNESEKFHRKIFDRNISMNFETIKNHFIPRGEYLIEINSTPKSGKNAITNDYKYQKLKFFTDALKSLQSGDGSIRATIYDANHEIVFFEG